MLLKLFLPVFLIFLKVINKNFKITYVVHIYGWHYISTGQYCYRTNEIGTKIVSPSGLIWNFFCEERIPCFMGKERKNSSVPLSPRSISWGLTFFVEAGNTSYIP